MPKRGGKRLIWKTLPITETDTLRHLEGAWASSKDSFGKGKVFVVRKGGLSEIETNLSLANLRDLARHVDVTLDLENGIVWDSVPSWEKPEPTEEDEAKEKARMMELADRRRRRLEAQGEPVQDGGREEAMS